MGWETEHQLLRLTIASLFHDSRGESPEEMDTARLIQTANLIVQEMKRKGLNIQKVLNISNILTIELMARCIPPEDMDRNVFFLVASIKGAASDYPSTKESE